MDELQTSLPSVSVLQRKFTLSELLDLDSFREVCGSYADLFKIGFKVFDTNNQLLVDQRGSSGDFCSYAFQFPEGKSRCMKEVAAIRSMQLHREPIEFNCFSGLRYLIAPIHHEGDLIGRVVYGPYRVHDAQATDFSGLGNQFDPDMAHRLLDKISKAKQEVVSKVVANLVQIVEVIVYTGYKQVLTARLHVEAVTSSYSELQSKNNQLRESYERLKELDRLKSSFLATVSHELRTPLTSVIGYSEMLIEGLAGDVNEEQHAYIQTIMEKGENLLTLIASILDYSKVESGNLRLNLALSDLRPVIETAVSTVIPIARHQNITVNCTLQDNLPRLNLDSGKLRQALVNILGNAVKFNRDGGRVDVLVDQVNRSPDDNTHDEIPAALAPAEQPYLRILVRDSGIGIPESQLHRIFDSFYQVDGSSTREYGGTGLGLAISNSYVKAHRGEIEVTSSLGQGTTFSILLPINSAGS